MKAGFIQFTDPLLKGKRKRRRHCRSCCCCCSAGKRERKANNNNYYRYTIAVLQWIDPNYTTLCAPGRCCRCNAQQSSRKKLQSLFSIGASIVCCILPLFAILLMLSFRLLGATDDSGHASSWSTACAKPFHNSGCRKQSDPPPRCRWDSWCMSHSIGRNKNQKS